MAAKEPSSLRNRRIPITIAASAIACASNMLQCFFGGIGNRRVNLLVKYVSISAPRIFVCKSMIFPLFPAPEISMAAQPDKALS